MGAQGSPSRACLPSRSGAHRDAWPIPCSVLSAQMGRVLVLAAHAERTWHGVAAHGMDEHWGGLGCWCPEVHNFQQNCLA